jgi:fimbrial chaperone protein
MRDKKSFALPGRRLPVVPNLAGNRRRSARAVSIPFPSFFATVQRKTENPMRSLMIFSAMTIMATLLPSGAAQATALQASPILVEMTPSTATSTLTVRNTGPTPFEVQTRVFRWVQENGKESLEEEATEVVTSPPMTTLQPGMSYSVRVVRTDRAPIQQEQAFRVFVDQLPNFETQRSGTVALVTRHSIPIFVMPAEAAPPKVDFSISSRNGRLVLSATNTGGRRLRLAQVSVTLPGGKKVSFGNGLLGYALAGGTMDWISPTGGHSIAAGQTVTINAMSDLGPVNVQAKSTR